jgi:class 3 adenylate cyclase/pSer/pThr/pTyr-binding forkhead associated (FHA) protein
VAELFVVNGVCGGTVFFLPDVPTVLGRSPECHIQIADPWISSMHALFERRGDELWVVDLDSRNGTFVEGQRVHEARVKPGVRIRFGKTAAELRTHSVTVEPQAVLSDQRTIIRYIADVACSAAVPQDWEHTTASPTPHPAARVDTLRGTGTGFTGPGRRQIGIVNEVCRSLLGAGSVEDSLDRILGILTGALAADHAGILLLDDQGRMVPAVANPADFDAAAHAGTIDAALRSRAGVLTVDPHPEPRTGRATAPVAPATRSCICAPIWADNRILGVIVLERASADPFTADDLELATLVGFHAALAVERGRSTERAEATEEARQRLLRHLDPAAAARVLAPQSPDAPDPLEPRQRDDAAILAVQVVGHGALAAARPPAEVAERALALQRALAGIIRAEGAAVDERIDGGLLAVLGLAQPRPDAAAVALRCARAMLERAGALEAVFEPPRLQVRVGVESGRVVTGNFGLPTQPEIRAVGDPVDIALRLCAEAAAGEALAGPGAARRSRRAGDEALEPRAGGTGSIRIV